MTYYTDPLVTLLHGDCIEVMATLPADSVDAVVTDPPYGIRFMGKAWDGADIEALTRNRREATEKRQREGRANHGTTIGSPAAAAGTYDLSLTANRSFQAWCEQWGREALRVTKPGGYLLAFGGTRTHHRLVCALEDAGWIIRDELTWIYASGFPKGKANLKPAHEPIVLARKPGPLRPLAIDASRIGTTETLGREKGGWGNAAVGATNYGNFNSIGVTVEGGRWPSNVLLSDPELFDEPNPYVVGSGATSVTNPTGDNHRTDYGDGGVTGWRSQTGFHLGDSGGYSRFFIVPKADRAERERGLADSSPQAAGKFNSHVYTGNVGAQQHVPVAARANVHPTVKPIDLMRHLVRLVTPSGGVVLDPFLGSGTTCLAASELGVCSIGIEREADYLAIAKDRLIATPMGLGLDVLSVDAS